MADQVVIKVAMHGFHSSVISRAVLVSMVIMLIWLLADSYDNDGKSCRQLNTDPNLWYIPKLDHVHQDHINLMIDNYFKRRSLNKSRYIKMLKSAKEGSFRGAIGGCIMNGPAGIIPGGLLFGILGAINTGLNRRIPIDDRNIRTINKF